MDKQEQQIFLLLEKYENGIASDHDISVLENWYQNFESKPDILSHLSSLEKLNLRDRMMNRIDNSLSDYSKLGFSQNKKIPIFWQRWLVAASVVVLLSIPYFLIFKKDQTQSQYSKVLKEDFAPGANRAILTLSSGEKIVLSEAKNGELAKQGNAVIQKKADGELIYTTSGSNTPVVINTMSTPRGGQYHLTLIDGTKVWLNAASSITYPSAFISGFRQVQITGEVYFEVAHNPEKPFLVKSGLQTIEVLGTQFNVNAYVDENQIKTTLYQGSVAISFAGKRKFLKPGQQAVLKDNSIKISQSDTDQAIAWKEGYFQFDNTDIETIMKQISRWYDVEVIFNGPITKQTFTGRISRFRNISDVLGIIQSYKDVELTFDGRRIMVK